MNLEAGLPASLTWRDCLTTFFSGAEWPAIMLSHSSGNGDIPEIRVDDSTPEGLLESNADDAQQLDVLFAWFAPAVRQGAHQLLQYKVHLF